ncbi:MAG: DeoR/GlpR transcriptional regulator, partial [Spirochaetes bacterium]
MKENNNLYLIERQNRILNLLKERKRVTVKDLSNFFKISEVTVRNDLKELARSGKIIRT